jgi:hypothetical protein
MIKGTKRPSPRQIKYGLNSSNFYLATTYWQVVPFVFNPKVPEDKQNIEKYVDFTDLLDNSEYEAYFVAENSQYVNPDLMEDEEMIVIPF